MQSGIYGEKTSLNKVDTSDRRRQVWIIMHEILHHFLLRVSFWSKEAECMEHEQRERGAEMCWRMMLYV